MPEDKQNDSRMSRIVVVAMIASIIAGLILAFWFNDGNWLWLCMFLILFLS